MCGQTVDDTRHTSRNHGTREVDTISHGVTGTNLDRNLIFIHQLHQLHTEWDDKTVNIGSCDILQVTAWADTSLQALTDDT